MPKVSFSLWPVINWLENGCDPKDAAVELRIYQDLLDKERAEAQVIQNNKKEEQ